MAVAGMGVDEQPLAFVEVGAGTIERAQGEYLKSGSGSVFARKLPCFEQMVGGAAEYGNREISQQQS